MYAAASIRSTGVISRRLSAAISGIEKRDERSNVGDHYISESDIWGSRAQLKSVKALLAACHRFYFVEHVAPARRDATHAKFVLYKRSYASHLIIAAFREAKLRDSQIRLETRIYLCEMRSWVAFSTQLFLTHDNSETRTRKRRMIDRARKLEENQRRGDMCNGIKNCKKKIIDVKVSKNFKFEKNYQFFFSLIKILLKEIRAILIVIESFKLELMYNGI